MKYKFTISILLFAAVVVLFLSCQKELSCEGPECRGIYDDGKATYTFVDSSGRCAGTFMTGKYIKDVDLEFENAVVVKVNVAKPGTYLITTDTVNGIYFQARGSFSNTATEPIVLYGKGKPLAPGNFIFTTNKSTGCTFQIEVSDKYFYDVTIDGIRYQQALEGSARNANFFNPDAQIPMFVRITNGQLVRHIDNSVSDEGLFIGKGLINQSNITVAGLTKFFAQGSYTFSPPNSADGIYIGWVNNGDPSYSWGTYDFPGTQSGSNFTITSVETYTDTQGRPIAKVKASFNCILYNKLGQSKVLTNGKFYGEFANILR